MDLQHANCFNDENINYLKKRVSEKIADYDNYSFTDLQDCALKTFFDLAQEFGDQKDFFSICVLIPKLFFNLDCNLYLIDNSGDFEMVCNSETMTEIPEKTVFRQDEIQEGLTLEQDNFSVPIKGNMQLLSGLDSIHHDGTLGIFEIRPASTLTDHMKFFFEKYANRIGFQLHNRLITEKNKEHLQFIGNLVNDIGHNVIVPNMYFKLFFRRMKGKIDRANKIGREMMKGLSSLDGIADDTAYKELFSLAEEYIYVNESMESQFNEITSHYEQTSLFLETLLRRSHFEKGQYVIEPKLVNFRERIIRPQLNRYLPRFMERDIGVDDQLSGIPDEEIMVVVDVGLISQAYANLFSNAVKYTRPVEDEQGNMHKYISVGMELMEGYFQDNKDGIKLNVFSTGPVILSEDIPNLFEEEFRGKNVEKEYGTGHGLHFIREVIGLHGGEYGYEATQLGNNFYFILPK